jgi:hypothetical protein
MQMPSNYTRMQKSCHGNLKVADGDDWWHSSVLRVPAWQVQDPKFKPQYHGGKKESMGTRLDGTCQQFQHSGSWDRRIMNFRPAWAPGFSIDSDRSSNHRLLNFLFASYTVQLSSYKVMHYNVRTPLYII